MDRWLAHGWILWAPVAAALLLWLALTWGREAAIARRIILQFLWTIALPVLILLGLPLAAMAAFVDFDARVWQALIAGLVIATGWLTTAIFAEVGKARSRAERLRDYHKAIYAEIGNNLATLQSEAAIDAHAGETIGKMEADGAYVPFIPRVHADPVYGAIIGSIDILPRQTIDAIVAYYSLIRAIADMADDMRSDDFRAMPQARRIAMYRDYSDMKKQALLFGRHALALIRSYSEGGAAAAERLAVSSSGAAPSATSPESE